MNYSLQIKNIGKRIYKERWSYVFILPAMLLFAVFLGYPLIRAVFLAFQKYQTGQSWWVGLENFKEVLTDDIFWLSLKHTFFYTLVRVPFNIFIALVMATLIYPISKKAQNWFRAAFYLPGVVSLVVIAMVWKWLYDPNYGLFNQTLIGLGAQPLAWLTSSQTALFSLMLMAVLSCPGAAVILYLAAMHNIPESLYEAGKIDGASRWQEWVQITIPLLNSTTLYLVVMNTIASFQVFTQVYVMTKGGPGYATQMVIPLIYSKAFQEFDFGVAAAQALLVFIVLGGISVVQFRMMRRQIEW